MLSDSYVPQPRHGSLASLAYSPRSSQPERRQPGLRPHYAPGLRPHYAECNSQGVLLGSSPRLQQLNAEIMRSALSCSSVLVSGEPGTGKEVIARAIHGHSARARGPWISVDCRAVPESILEVELFGHERGLCATRGPIGQNGHSGRSRLESAEGGTLFLGEVGALSLSLQARLLHLLDTQEYVRVGSTGARRANVRLITSSSRCLRQQVLSGRFRQELYQHLHGVTVRVPALRERRDDIAALSRHFLRRYSRAQERPLARLTENALAQLQDHSWPGNLRELGGTLERAATLCNGTAIHTLHLPERLRRSSISGGPIPRGPAATPAHAVRAAVVGLEAALLGDALARAAGSYECAARWLGLSEPTLRARAASHGLSIPILE
jgi:two-component system, NtrC family, response regulator HydG